jgi:diaminopimelate decarboxylase
MISRENMVEIADREMGEGGLFVYDSQAMEQTAQELLDTEMPYGMTVRYAAKANPHPGVVRLFDGMGVHFDASSAQEARYLLGRGIDGEKISLSSQNLRDNTDLRDAIEQDVLPVATTLRQVSMLGAVGLGEIAVRINPGEGSGHNNRTTVGGPASSFGIWKDQLPEVLQEADRHDMGIDRIHTHIGSGVDPSAWRDTMIRSLGIVEQCPDVKTLDIGGGYKIARMPEEEATDMDEVLGIFAEELERFADRTGREIHLEIEPGTFLVGNAGTLLGRVEEAVSTDMYDFLKLNVGMNAILRPSLYGAQHPIEVLNDSEEEQDYVVVGPCCESGDILTPAPGNPEEILPRRLRKAVVGDYVAIGGAGAYCASMSASKYNHIPPADELVV